MDNFNNSRILITGGTGSWGKVLIPYLLNNYDVEQIICYSRNENQQVIMQRELYDHKIRYVLGDVRDKDALDKAAKNCDYIFHLAAMKHVPLCEKMPEETIKTNINGTQNVIDVAIKNRVGKVIYVSSDKAVEPINVYGMTKAVGEKLIVEANNRDSHTRFVCVRGGNVMGSSGSVIPLFIDRIKCKSSLNITDKRMTRFFLTLDDAIRLLLNAAENSIGGETFVMNMPSCFIVDLAQTLMDAYGKTDIQFTGIRPGEKLDEILVSRFESMLTYAYDDSYFVILPRDASQQLSDHYKNKARYAYDMLSSKTHLMNKNQIRAMLIQGKFI